MKYRNKKTLVFLIFGLLTIFMLDNFDYFKLQKKTFDNQSNKMQKFFEGKPGKMFAKNQSKLILPINFDNIPDLKLKNIRGFPEVHLKINKDDLFSKKRGIISNHAGKGKIWERVAEFSYHFNNQELFKSNVGVRLHGGTHRYKKDLKKKSFRIYFRKKLGESSFMPHILNMSKKGPKRLLIHVDSPKKFIPSISYDFVNIIGGEAVRAIPVLFHLNGEYIGVFYISDHVNQNVWKRKIGHDNFYFYKFKGTSDRNSVLAFKKLQSFVDDKSEFLTTKRIGKIIDMDSYMTHIFSYMYLGTVDWVQGAAIKNLKDQAPKWKWITWDMDRGLNYSPSTRNRLKANWEQKGVELYLNPETKDIRSDIFRRLVNEDPKFSKLFYDFCIERLSNKKNKNQLSTNLKHYEKLSKNYGGKVKKSMNEIQTFFDRRRDFFINELDTYLNKNRKSLISWDGNQKEITGSFYKNALFLFDNLNKEITSLLRSKNKFYELKKYKIKYNGDLEGIAGHDDKFISFDKKRASFIIFDKKGNKLKTMDNVTSLNNFSYCVTQNSLLITKNGKLGKNLTIEKINLKNLKNRKFTIANSISENLKMMSCSSSGFISLFFKSNSKQIVKRFYPITGKKLKGLQKRFVFDRYEYRSFSSNDDEYFLISSGSNSNIFNTTF